MNTKICPCCGKKIEKRLTRGSVLSKYEGKQSNIVYWYLLPGYKIYAYIVAIIETLYMVYQKNAEIRPRFKCKECDTRLIPFKYLRNEIIAFIVCGLALTAVIIYGIIIDTQIYLIFMPIVLVLLFLAVSVPLNFSGGFTFARKMYASYDEEWVNLKVKFEKNKDVSDDIFNKELMKWNLFKTSSINNKQYYLEYQYTDNVDGDVILEFRIVDENFKKPLVFNRKLDFSIYDCNEKIKLGEAKVVPLNINKNILFKN